MKSNLGFYVQKINDIVKDTETIGESMNPFFEEVRTALDTDQVASLGAGKIGEIKTNFTAGVAQYDAMLTTIKGLRPPAKVLGIHKKLEKSFSSYVASCQAMVDALDSEAGTVAQAQFDQAEKEQDEQTDSIAFCIQRMTSILLK